MRLELECGQGHRPPVADGGAAVVRSNNTAVVRSYNRNGPAVVRSQNTSPSS
jgi:hypothetical protein